MIGVTFDDLHSYDDLSLVLNSKTIEPPTPKTETVDIPGADGELDFTEFFGEVKFKNRKLAFNFSYIGLASTFTTELSAIQTALHGKKMKICLDDDPDYYYVGRVTVGTWTTQKGYFTIEITANCEPYKYAQTVTVVSNEVEDELEIMLENSRKSVIPKISTTGAITIAWDGASASLSAGNDQIIEDLILREGMTVVTVTGNAEVTFKYQEGAL